MDLQYDGRGCEQGWLPTVNRIVSEEGAAALFKGVGPRTIIISPLFGALPNSSVCLQACPACLHIDLVLSFSIHRRMHAGLCIGGGTASLKCSLHDPSTFSSPGIALMTKESLANFFHVEIDHKHKNAADVE
jgi:hypothetical protein